MVFRKTNKTPQVSYLNDETVNEADEALYRAIRAVIGPKYLKVSVRAGGPLSISEAELGHELAWQLRKALATTEHGATAVYFRSMATGERKGQRVALVRWLHIERGHTITHIATVLRLSQPYISRHLLKGDHNGAGKFPPCPAYTDELALYGLPYVETEVFGAPRATLDTPSQRVVALAVKLGKAESTVQRQVLLTGAVARDIASLAPARATASEPSDATEPPQ